MYIFKSGKKKVHNCELININMLIKKKRHFGENIWSPHVLKKKQKP